jgi:hypothetical protein
MLICPFCLGLLTLKSVFDPPYGVLYFAFGLIRLALGLGFAIAGGLAKPLFDLPAHVRCGTLDPIFVDCHFGSLRPIPAYERTSIPLKRSEAPI